MNPENNKLIDINYKFIDIVKPNVVQGAKYVGIIISSIRARTHQASHTLLLLLF